MYDDAKIPRGCFALSKSNSVADPGGDLKIPGVFGTGFRGVWVDTTGNLKVTFCDGTTAVLTVPDNYLFWGEISRVWTTGTTCGCTYGIK